MLEKSSKIQYQVYIKNKKARKSDLTQLTINNGSDPPILLNIKKGILASKGVSVTVDPDKELKISSVEENFSLTINHS